MTNLAPPGGGEYAGPAAFLMAAAALVKSLLHRGLSEHKVRNAINVAVGPLSTRVAVLEAKYEEIDHRLTRIDDGQVRLEGKIDRALARR